MKIMGNLKEWLGNQRRAGGWANKFVFLGEAGGGRPVTGEAHLRLTDILHKIENITQEADKIAEKNR